MKNAVVAGLVMYPSSPYDNSPSVCELNNKKLSFKDGGKNIMNVNVFEGIWQLFFFF
jgi:hypothetical protein